MPHLGFLLLVMLIGLCAADTKGKCRLHPACAILGGHCVKDPTDPIDCRGRLVPDGCRPGNCQCCIPGCPEDEGFFLLPSTNQCFKYFKDRPRNWTESNELCLAENLVMAQPYDAVNLRSYIVQRYGFYSEFWLGACGDGTYIQWQNNGDIIRSTNPLWYPNMPGNRITPVYCLLLLANDGQWKNDPETPYYSEYYVNVRYTLCE
ncbi:unnamed protein product, partial [Meganyctiphanes norvegica]